MWTIVLALFVGSGAAAASDLTALVQPYLEIQQTLNADSLEGLTDQAARVASAAATLGSGAESIRASAAELQQAADLSAARAAFGTLSDAIIAFAKRSGATFGEGVKVAYCPMARKHWLQKGDEIRNPFYGKQMSGCGRFVAGTG